ncbi:MAG: capsular biosynthesis protein [Acetobacteraceae bacterium]|nr:capsular biosynthesis protein [Acetobacteraceae bacterium]
MNASAILRAGRRSILVLQGVASPFFAALGAALAARGHAVHRINFCRGDRLFWPLPGGIDFREPADHWPGFLAATLDRLGVTDLVMFGDARPLHEAALAVARRAGVRPWVFEEGYLRPNWITLECGGTNAQSRLPRDPRAILLEGALLPDRGEGEAVAGGMALRVRDEVRYHAANLGQGAEFPHYRHHRPWPFFQEVACGWLPRLAGRPLVRALAKFVIGRLLASGRPFVLFPLQLDGDVQIRRHSPFGRLAPAIEHVLESFAAYSPPDLALLVKVHPLDNGMTRWASVVARTARRFGVADRVLTVDGGHLPTLLEHARAVVTVNSTVGFSALLHHRPVVALGYAIYDLPGLTHRSGLDRFWTKPERPNRHLLLAFRRVVIARSQLNGSFYTPNGIARGVAEAVERIERGASLLVAREAAASTS